MRRIRLLRTLAGLAGLLAAGPPGRAALPEELARKLGAATVYIESEVVLSATDWDALPEAVRRQVGRRPQGITSGSGFLISSDGLVLTNAHVIGLLRQKVTVGRDGEIEMRFLPLSLKVVVRSGTEGEKTYTPRTVKVDERLDLALLKIPAQPDVAPLALRPAPPLGIGAAVYMAGFPGGKIPDLAPFGGAATMTTLRDARNPKVSINAGTITALREEGRGERKDTIYQLDVRANPGNSGGPILNEEGEVVAVLNAGIPSMQSINYAIPARYLKALLPSELTGAWPGETGTSGEVQAYETFKASGTFKLGK